LNFPGRPPPVRSILCALMPENPEWVEISLQVDPEAQEAVGAFLFDLGCQGLISEEGRETLTAYMPFQENLDLVRHRIASFLADLQTIFPQVISSKFSIKGLEDQDWGRSWRRFFKARRVTARLTVIPPWEPETPKGHVLKIDPGPAFGTGQHATTRLCLEAMEQVPMPESWTMLDVGTGSGILAIYGVSLGAERVAAVDLDPEALRWAQRNAALNGLEGAVELFSRPVEEWKEETFSLVTANLMLSEILRLIPCFRRLLEPGGWLILSGILTDQVEEVEQALSEWGFKRQRLSSEGEWACMVGCKGP